MHALGDVPSPIAVGALKDDLAPDCTPADADDDDRDDLVIPDDCDHEQTQLRMVLLFIMGWVAMSPLAFAIAWFLASRRRRESFESERHSSPLHPKELES